MHVRNFGYDVSARTPARPCVKMSAVRETRTWARSSGVAQCHLEIHFKFLFVRNQFETLISAYKDKFVETPDVHYMERYANKM